MENFMHDKIKYLRYFVFLLIMLVSANVMAADASSSSDKLSLTGLKNLLQLTYISIDVNKNSNPTHVNILVDGTSVKNNISALQEMGVLNPNLSSLKINTMPTMIAGTVSFQSMSLILQTMYQSLGADRLHVYVYLSRLDSYGNSEKKLLYSFRFNKKIANKINWNNFNGENLNKVAIDFHDSIFFDESIRKEYYTYRQLTTGN